MTQVALAKAVGVHQSAISQMIAKKRNIFVVEHDDGTLSLEEVRQIRSTKSEPALGAA